MVLIVEGDRPSSRLRRMSASTSEGRSLSRGEGPSSGTRCDRAMPAYRSLVACLRSLASSALLIHSSSQPLRVIVVSLTGPPTSSRCLASLSLVRTSV
jgi:hypothetical protein